MNEFLFGWLTKGHCAQTGLDTIAMVLEIGALIVVAMAIWYIVDPNARKP